MSILTRRGSLRCLGTVLVSVAVLAGCGNNQTGEARTAPPPSLIVLPTGRPTKPPTPTPFVFGPLTDSDLDLGAPPVEVPLELEIPSLNVSAPMWGVGLTTENAMDSPRGSLGDPVWNTAFWYRGGGIPGDIGTATIAGHVNDPLGDPAIFAHVDDLKRGAAIIVHLKSTSREIRFTVDEIKVYTVKQSSDPAVLTRIFGVGPVTGIVPQPSPDGLSHLTLITCAGDIVDGAFDEHTVVYATRSK